MPTTITPPWAPTADKVQAAVERFVATARPKRIILFGSRARGDADVRSDVDLMVIKAHIVNRHEELVELDRALAGLTIPVDILLVSEAEFEERSAQAGTVERAAQREGRVLYAADRPEVLLRKAKQDELAVEKLLDDRDIEDDLIGFHAQQAAEKMLKALLAARQVDYPKTHNLRVLVELLFAEGVRLPEKLSEIDRLTQFGTTFRYDSISIADSRDRMIWLGWIRYLRALVEPLPRE